MYCSHCGNKLKIGAKFCGSCGAKIEVHSAVNNKLLNIRFNPKRSSACSVNITRAIVEGPDDHNALNFSLKYSVVNNSKMDWEYIRVILYFFDEKGAVVEEFIDPYEQTISSGETVEFETVFEGLSASVLPKPDQIQASVYVLASTMIREKLPLLKLSPALNEIQALPPHLFGDGLSLVTGSVWINMPDDDGDCKFNVRLFLQNISDLAYSNIKAELELSDKFDRNLGQVVEQIRLEAGDFSLMSGSCYIKHNKVTAINNIELAVSLFPPTAEGIGHIIGFEHESTDEATADTDDEVGSDSQYEGDGLKRVYIKTEPGGRVLFGKLSEEDAKLLRNSVKHKTIDERLTELRFNSSGEFREYEGVFNSGQEGDFGNEGIILIDPDGPISLEHDTLGKYVDGSYILFLSLSKVSIEFEFNPNEPFKIESFEEVSVPVILPSFIEHDTYGHPNYNVVTDYKYNGEYIGEYDRELADRGYDNKLYFITVEDGKPRVVYSCFNEVESWEVLKEKY